VGRRHVFLLLAGASSSSTALMFAGAAARPAAKPNSTSGERHDRSRPIPLRRRGHRQSVPPPPCFPAKIATPIGRRRWHTRHGGWTVTGTACGSGNRRTIRDQVFGATMISHACLFRQSGTGAPHQQGYTPGKCRSLGSSHIHLGRDHWWCCVLERSVNGHVLARPRLASRGATVPADFLSFRCGVVVLEENRRFVRSTHQNQPSVVAAPDPSRIPKPLPRARHLPHFIIGAVR
jgi:hypothetical protein